MFRTVESLDDPAIWPYVDLRADALNRTRDDFVVEGHWIAERLIASDLSVRSMLVTPRHAERYAEKLADDIPVLVASNELIRQIVGYDFHRGVLSHGTRPPFHSIDEFVRSGARRALAMVGVTDPENVGGLLRTAAALGFNDIFLGPKTLDPFLRRVVRVSMGAAFVQRFYKLDDPIGDLAILSAAGVPSLATTLDASAPQILSIEKRIVAPPSRWLLLLGNEAEGLSPEIQSAATLRVTLPMPPVVDSLNVAAAGAIFMHELTRSEHRGG